MHVENHVAAVISYYSSGVGRHAVKEGTDAAHGVLGGVALLPCNFAEGDEDCRVNGPVII